MSDQTGTGQLEQTGVRSLLLPLQDNFALIPRSCISEVMPLRYLTQPPGDMPEWFAGHVVWRDIILPVIDFSLAAGIGRRSSGNRRKACVLPSFADRPGPSHYAIICERLPQPLLAVPEILQQQPQENDSALILHRILVGRRPAIVPDLEATEVLLSQHPEIHTD